MSRFFWYANVLFHLTCNSPHPPGDVRHPPRDGRSLDRAHTPQSAPYRIFILIYESIWEI